MKTTFSLFSNLFALLMQYDLYLCQQQQHISMNKTNISVLLHLHINSLLQKKAMMQTCLVNLCINLWQSYSTLDTSSVMTLSLPLICLLFRLYSCNITAHLINNFFCFFLSYILLMNLRGLWSVSTINGWNVKLTYISKCSKTTIRQDILFQWRNKCSDVCQAF